MNIARITGMLMPRGLRILCFLFAVALFTLAGVIALLTTGVKTVDAARSPHGQDSLKRTGLGAILSLDKYSNENIVHILAPGLGNYPNKSVALSANATVVPTAAPTGALSMNVSTSSGFNGNFVADPATGVIRITNAYPAGTYLVTVKAFDAAGSTTRTFTLTVNSGTACAGTVQFTSAPIAIPGSTESPIAVSVADFNNDGNQDFAIIGTSQGPNSNDPVYIRLGDGSGGVSAAANVVVGGHTSDVAVGDFNNDGKSDLAVVDGSVSSNSPVSIRLGNGSGGFSGTTTIFIIAGARYLTVADFNNDGRPDLAATNSGGTVSIRLGNGAGSFSGTTSINIGSEASRIAVADFNNDGKLDFAAVNGANTVAIRLGDGAGGFSGNTNVSVGNGADNVATGDFNNNGVLDLATANISAGTVSIRLGNGSGGFTGATDINVGDLPGTAAVGDFNNDGKLDFAVTSLATTAVSIRLGDGLGGFSNAPDFTVEDKTFPLVVGDFNNDGKQDLAALPGGGSYTHKLFIGLGGCVLSTTPTPTATPLACSLVVTTTQDVVNAGDGINALREAIDCSNGNAGADTITFAPAVAGTITLGGTELLITDSVTIQGPGADVLAISGNNTSRIFRLNNGPTINWTVSGLTIANGNPGFASGAGIFDQNNGFLTINACTIRNNTGFAGAGVAKLFGPLTIADSTISNNNASGFTGGGVFVGGGATITNTTIAGNNSYGGGGGIMANGNTLTIRSSTIFGNTVSSVDPNAVAGGIRSYATAVVIVENTIIAGNSTAAGGGPDVFSDNTPFTSQGYNLIGKSDGSAGFVNGVNADQVGTIASPVNPMLGPLANNGGATPTFALLSGSPALDKGNSFGLTTDQRGLARPADDVSIANAAGGDGSDIGSWELQVAAGTPTPTPGSGSISGVVTYGTTPSGTPAKFVPGVGLAAVGSTPANAVTNSAGAYSLNGLGSGAHTVTPSKTGDVNGLSGLDAARVAQHVAGLIVLTPNQQLAGDTTKNGSLSGLDAARIAQTVAGLPNPGFTGQWIFLPASRTYPSVPGALTGENYEAILLGDVTGNWTPTAAPEPASEPRTDADNEYDYTASPIAPPAPAERAREHGSTASTAVLEVEVPANVTAAPGEQITIPVRIGDATGKGIVAYDFTLVFDPDVLVPSNAPLDFVGTVSDGWTAAYSTQAPGRISVTAFSTAELTGKGVLLNLRFNAATKAGGSTELKWEAFELNENEVPSKPSDGQCTVQGVPSRPALKWLFGAGRL
jgi:hypothetical protein